MVGEMVKKKTTQQFINEAKIKHGNKYDYSKVDYINDSTEVLIICKEHGPFKQKPSNHLQGQGCIYCYRKRQSKERKLSKDQFEKKAQKIHDNKYDYSLVEYQTSHTPVTIICPVHGSFEQKPNDHLSGGHGCPFCFSEKRSFYSLGWINKRPSQQNKSCNIYLIQMYDENESFLKFGITQKDVTERYRNRITTGGYQYKILLTLQTTLKDAILKEQEAKNRFRGYRYQPQRSFKGYTECYQIEIKSDFSQII